MMEEVAYFEQRAERDINVFDKEITNLVKQGKKKEAQVLLTKYTRDFAGATMIKWEELESTYWGKFGMGF
jgi:hypothetical protein